MNEDLNLEMTKEEYNGAIDYLNRFLRAAEVGDVVYLESDDVMTIRKLQTGVASYAKNYRLKLASQVLRVVDTRFNVFPKVLRVEVLTQ